jgi:hypothetical protein
VSIDATGDRISTPHMRRVCGAGDIHPVVRNPNRAHISMAIDDHPQFP